MKNMSTADLTNFLDGIPSRFCVACFARFLTKLLISSCKHSKVSPELVSSISVRKMPQKLISLPIEVATLLLLLLAASDHSPYEDRLLRLPRCIFSEEPDPQMCQQTGSCFFGKSMYCKTLKSGCGDSKSLLYSVSPFAPEFLHPASPSFVEVRRSTVPACVHLRFEAEPLRYVKVPC